MKTWADLIAEKRGELESAARQAEFDAYTNNFGTGWTFDVVLDCDGTVEEVGPRNNSQSEREWNGRAVCLYSTSDEGWGYEDDSDNCAMSWLYYEEPDADVAEWIKKHEIIKEDDHDWHWSEYSWSWAEDEGYGKRHYFDELLPDDLYRRALNEYLDSDWIREARENCFDRSNLPGWIWDELPKE